MNDLAPIRSASSRRWNGATPPDYVAVYRWRAKRIRAIREDAKICRAAGKEPQLLMGAIEYYRTRPAEFIEHWCDTSDPRNAAKPGALTSMPMVLFPRQKELVNFFHQLVTVGANGLIEKSRDMGATWVACAFSVWAWRFMPGAAIGWGSRLAAMVDELGDPKSIFEKMRQCIMGLPRDFWPKGFDPDKHMLRMRIINPENGATIVGETGDNIGRGGRTLMYFVDEAAHLEHPELTEAALGNNTNVQVKISSVNGIGNVFHRQRKAGTVWRPGVDLVRNRYNIFIMDWSENPLHTQEWFDNMKEEKESAGLYHVFAQEVLRDYSGAVAGVIIPQKFVLACIDAHKIIPGMRDGKWVAALDPADPTGDGGGEDRGDGHAAGARKGVILEYSDWWADGDVGAATRRTAGVLVNLTDGAGIEVQYDSVGVGAGVKSETNRLMALPANDPDRMPRGMRWIAWNAGSGVLNPDEHISKLPNGAPDKSSATNKEQYANLKAQAWWHMRVRCEKTMKAVEAVKNGEPCPYDPMELCSLDSSKIPPHILSQLTEELSQPVRKKDIVSTKMTVDKKPAGTRSPNLADETVMLFFPIPQKGYDWSAFT